MPAKKRSIDPAEQRVEKRSPESDLVTRSQKPRRQWMEQRLIVSNHTTHTAAELCNSNTSWGPDFVGSDGKFCDMGTKTVSPLCSVENVEGCVHVDHQSGTVTVKRSIGRRDASTEKSYKKVSQW